MNKELTNEQKDRIINQALAIKINEVIVQENLVGTGNDVIDSIPIHLGVVYNEEIISDEEVKALMEDWDNIREDPRVLVADYEVIKNIFPHMGELAKETEEQDGQG